MRWNKTGNRWTQTTLLMWNSHTLGTSLGLVFPLEENDTWTHNGKQTNPNVTYKASKLRLSFLGTEEKEMSWLIMKVDFQI
jgi:hypothetical protein